jgi:hypothetical protein
MSTTRSNTENKQIYDLCQTIRSFCFANAAREFINTNSKNKEALREAQKTSMASEISIIVNNYDWKNLFTNEKWLVILEEVALMNLFKKYKPANDALIKLLELFPKETEGRINSLFLQKSL